jgi:sugar (pentulose or hexulose) kinase
MIDTGERVAVLDLGKTNIKVLVATPDGTPVESLSYPNAPDTSGPYLAIDLRRIESLILDALAELGARHKLRAIVATAHGCGGVLVDDQGPVLPAMDYEAKAPDWLADIYREIVPSYDEVFCSISGGAMRPAQGLLWQAHDFPDVFYRAKHFLLIPQYFAFRLGGRPVTEISSLAAQCHLWNPLKGNFSSIVKRQKWQHLFPAFAKAGEVIGHLSAGIAERTGLSREVEILVGAHDSNANFYRYKAAGLADHTVLSTGTWMIGFNRGRPLHAFSEARAMVANVDVDGEPIASTLTMTGREYAILAGEPSIADTSAFDAVQGLLDRGTLALPSFVEDPGPFPASGGKGNIIGPPPSNPAERGALAALYAAFVADLCLDVLGSTTPIVIDGGFATNPVFGRILASLRPSQPLLMSQSKDGTALGAGLLWHRFERRNPVGSVTLNQIAAKTIPGLRDAATRWRTLSDAPSHL